MVEFLNRYVSIQKESTYGQEPTAGVGNGERFGEVDDESLATTYDLMTRQDMSRPIAAKSVTGTERTEGDINLAMQVDDFVGNLLYSFFPQDAYDGAADPIFTHVLTEPSLTNAAAGVYPSWTIRVGREEKEHTFLGMMTNSLSISASVGEYVMMSIGFVGKRESTPGDLATPTFDGEVKDALYFSNGTVTFDDATGTQSTASASIKSISFDINLNRDTDNAYGLGDSTYRRAPPAQRREISGTIEFNKVLYGDQSLDEPDYTQLVAADGVEYNAATSSRPVMILNFVDEAAADFIKFEFFKIRFEAPEASVSGRDTNTMTVNFVALYDDTFGGAMRTTVQGTHVAQAAYDA